MKELDASIVRKVSCVKRIESAYCDREKGIAGDLLDQLLALKVLESDQNQNTYRATMK